MYFFEQNLAMLTDSPLFICSTARSCLLCSPDALRGNIFHHHLGTPKCSWPVNPSSSWWTQSVETFFSFLFFFFFFKIRSRKVNLGDLAFCEAYQKWMFNNLLFLCQGTKTNSALQRHHAQEDPELCQERSGQTHHYQRGQGRRCQLGCHPGMLIFFTEWKVFCLSQGNS